MSKKISSRIDRFYIVLSAILIILAVFVVVVIQGIFGAIGTSGKVNEDVLNAPSPHLNRDSLDTAVEELFNAKTHTLDLK